MMCTEAELIALLIHPIWTYYRYLWCERTPPRSIQEIISSGTDLQVLDAFPNLTRAEASFLWLVADIIAGREHRKSTTSV